METKKSKYDTNPLDADVAGRAEDAWREGEGGPATQEVKRSTHQIGTPINESESGSINSEAPTKRYDAPPQLDGPYPSVFVPPAYSPPAKPQTQDPQFQPASPQSAPSRRSVPG